MSDLKTETTGSTGREASEHERLVSDARCPQCGDKVFLPKDSLRAAYGGDNGKHDPQVWCSDFAHWIGFLSECAH